MDFLKVPFIAVNGSKNDIDYFKKKFNKKPGLCAATLQICGLGFFCAYLNGKKIGNYYFTPAFTDYLPRPALQAAGEKYAFYHAFDIAPLLAEGENVLEVFVGGGYFENTDRPDLKKYADVPAWCFGRKRLKFLLTLQYADETAVVFSDTDTLCCETGNRSSLFSGDAVDFTAALPPLRQPVVLRDAVRVRPSPLGGSVAQPLAGQLLAKSDTYRLYDFAQNHTGGLTCRVKGRRGAVLTVSYGEFLNADGSLNLVSSAYDTENESGDTVKHPQINTYRLSGDWDEIRPLFSWRCYRYAELSCDSAFETADFRSLFIHQECVQTGHFSCGNAIINEIYEKYLQTQLCNLQCGVPTDCPHREKMPYTGDGWLTQRAAMYSFSLTEFYDKWLDDILNAQLPDGNIPNTAPFMGCGGGRFWGYAVCAVPLCLYTFTGKLQYLARAYDSVRRWIDFLGTKHRGNYILTESESRWLLPDWLAPQPMQMDVAYFSTVCYYKSVTDFIEMQRLLYGAAEQKWVVLAEKIKNALNETFFDSEKCCYSKDVQGETALAADCGIVPPDLLPRVLQTVVRHYEAIGHFDTGIIMTPIVVSVLTSAGRSDLAFRLLTAADAPSFAEMLQGETTLPEHWSRHWIPFELSENGESSKLTGDVSHCHPMYGAVVAFFYEKIAGIDCLNVANRQVKIHPCMTAEILSAKASVTLESGVLSAAYKNGDCFEMQLTVPPGYTAEVILPQFVASLTINGRSVSKKPRLSAGIYEICGKKKS